MRAGTGQLFSLDGTSLTCSDLKRPPCQKNSSIAKFFVSYQQTLIGYLTNWGCFFYFISVTQSASCQVEIMESVWGFYIVDDHWGTQWRCGEAQNLHTIALFPLKQFTIHVRSVQVSFHCQKGFEEPPKSTLYRTTAVTPELLDPLTFQSFQRDETNKTTLRYSMTENPYSSENKKQEEKHKATPSTKDSASDSYRHVRCLLWALLVYRNMAIT